MRSNGEEWVEVLRRADEILSRNALLPPEKRRPLSRFDAIKTCLAANREAFEAQHRELEQLAAQQRSADAPDSAQEGTT